MTTVCLTFDFDAVSIWVSTFKKTSASPLSRGEYGARIGVGRILDMLGKNGVKGTFFTPGHTAVNFPEQTKRIFAEGHEVAAHGYCHESPVELDRAEEKRLLQGSVEKLKSVLGEDFVPVGYRSPAWDLSVNSIDVLEELGFRYDSSLMADDFVPYHPRRNDYVDEEVFTRGPEAKLLQFPVAWELDDYPYFHFSSRPYNQGLRNPSDVYEIWKQEFDYCHEHIKDGVFTLTFHPEISGRGPRVLMLERLIKYMKSCEGVTFSTLADEAQRRLSL